MPKIAHAKRIERCRHGGCPDQATHHCADCGALRCAAHAAHECCGAAPPSAAAASVMQFSPAAPPDAPQEPEQPCETTSAAD